MHLQSLISCGGSFGGEPLDHHNKRPCGAASSSGSVQAGWPCTFQRRKTKNVKQSMHGWMADRSPMSNRIERPWSPCDDYGNTISRRVWVCSVQLVFALIVVITYCCILLLLWLLVSSLFLLLLFFLLFLFFWFLCYSTSSSSFLHGCVLCIGRLLLSEANLIAWILTAGSQERDRCPSSGRAIFTKAGDAGTGSVDFPQRSADFPQAWHECHECRFTLAPAPLRLRWGILGVGGSNLQRRIGSMCATVGLIFLSYSLDQFATHSYWTVFSWCRQTVVSIGFFGGARGWGQSHSGSGVIRGLGATTGREVWCWTLVTLAFCVLQSVVRCEFETETRCKMNPDPS